MTRQRWLGRCGMCQGELEKIAFISIGATLFYLWHKWVCREIYCCTACGQTYGSTRSAAEREQYNVRRVEG